MPRTYIKDGQHKSIKNLTEYKLIQQKIDCCRSSCQHPNKIQDYYDNVAEQHKDFLDKHNLLISKFGKVEKKN